MPTVPPTSVSGAMPKGDTATTRPLPGARHPMPLRRQTTEGEVLEQLKGAAKSFEALYVYTLLKEMRKTVPESGYLKSGIGHGVYQSMYDEAIAEQIAETGSVGLARSLVERYIRDTQGVEQGRQAVKFVTLPAEREAQLGVSTEGQK